MPMAQNNTKENSMSNSQFSPLLDMIKNNVSKAEGELFNFVNAAKKKSAAVARECLLNVAKICKDLRQKISDTKKEMPIRRRNMTAEQRKAVADKRKATIAAKKAAKAKKSPEATIPTL